MSRRQQVRPRDAVAIVAAHPDDEVLGCGGTAARLAEEGRAVHVLLMADGEGARVSRSRRAGLRKAVPPRSRCRRRYSSARASAVGTSRKASESRLSFSKARREGIVLNSTPSSVTSPAPCTAGWLARICSTSVVPERIMPTIKIGKSLSPPKERILPNHSAE